MIEIRYGVRISGLDGGDTVLVEQTWREHPGSGNNRFTLNHPPDGKRFFRHVKFDDDAGIAEAVRDALKGQLS